MGGNGDGWTTLFDRYDPPEPIARALDEANEVDPLGDDFVRFSIFQATFDTSDPGQREELREFVIRPIDFLIDGSDEAGGRLALAGVTRRWRIATTINNHHKNLNPRIVFSTAIVDEDEETVNLNLHKQNKKQ